MASLDLVWSLVQSAQVRIQLLKISSIFNLSNDRRLRAALEKDEGDLGRLLQRIINTEHDKKKLLELKGESAQCCVDLIQDVLDKGTLPTSPLAFSSDPDSDNLTLKARRLLVKLSEVSDTLPASLFIRGVLRVEKEATFGGTFGDIYRASYEGRDVALKRIRVFQRDQGRHRIRQRFCREALLWQRLKHPFVLPFTGINAESFPSFLCMVSPWMRHGTINNHLAQNGNANVELRLFEIAQGLAYLHSQDIIHGDLRGSNILVDDGWHVRLADFGLAVFSDATIATQTSHRGGSVRWMSPELHFPQSCGLETFQRTFASDVYSFALLCIEVLIHLPALTTRSRDC
ncbi:kinase-like domain-containing protein [Mycena amicta]|nr:kinase-like domain-containing protein [Mycena amicta]